ncbi:hypothetical protein CY34DRAFT_808898 [Suillus luteus UH-Slu-Lm8-n1]|uniref:Uncharacterized protein n=1 Tax=Suillus luteus UH-Slu-Lm8-n1 TaxID=930992 RepID=A0A0D0AL63_9AGAM|nr:hypothetical protein CY34DRAFT_808898 [Suillus luteus UH-Slu-Lm8-n1]
MTSEIKFERKLVIDYYISQVVIGEISLTQNPDATPLLHRKTNAEPKLQCSGGVVRCGSESGGKFLFKCSRTRKPNRIFPNFDRRCVEQACNKTRA